MFKKIALFVLLASTLAIWQVFFSTDVGVDSQQYNHQEESSENTTSSELKKNLKANNVKVTVIDNNSYSDPHRDDVRGGQYQSIDYGSYEISTLEALATAGDVKAMKVLALRYLEMASKENISYEKLIEYSAKKNEYTSKAIIYGDREMLSAMPELKNEISRLEDSNLAQEERHDKVLNVLAYYEFMGLRGSMKDKYDGQRLFFKTYSGLLSLPASLSEIDKNSVRIRAKEIYGLYEQKRIELGLGSFDNSNTDNVIKAYEMQREIYLSEMGPLAIE